MDLLAYLRTLLARFRRPAPAPERTYLVCPDCTLHVPVYPGATHLCLPPLQPPQAWWIELDTFADVDA